MIVPAPRKPMPLTTCAGMRPGSAFSKLKNSVMNCAVIMTTVVPMHTSI